MSMKPKQIKMMLASRMMVHANAIDKWRESDTFTPEEYMTAGIEIGKCLDVIHELERIWENFFDEVPDLAEVTRLSLEAANS